MEFSPSFYYTVIYFLFRQAGELALRIGGAGVLRACNDLSLPFHCVTAIILVSCMCFVKLHISSEKSLYLFKVLSTT